MIELDPTELEGLAASLELNQKQMLAAARTAANRTIRWARVQVQRGLSSRLGVPRAAFQGRVKIKQARGRAASGSVWIALNPLNIVDVNPTKTSSGYRAGREQFPGAFIGKGRYGGKAGLRRKGSSRLPLEAVSLDVLTEGGPLIDREIWPELNERFLSFYQDELQRRAG